MPSPKDQSNFTDPDSRIMKTTASWVQGYNAQVLVNEHQVIIAQEVSDHPADTTRLAAMLNQSDDNLASVGVALVERRAGVFTADAGYCSEKNLAFLAERRIDAYVATGWERHHRTEIDPLGRTRTPLCSAMRAKLRAPHGHAIYARRKTLTEPVHGLIKQARGFQQFLLRGA